VSGNQIRSFGLDIISLVRGGFFPANNSDARQAAIKDNLLAIDEAAALGAKWSFLYAVQTHLFRWKHPDIT
jgi:sugar phosphate isomerase/epimerase